jgi:hypothetical protein
MATPSTGDHGAPWWADVQHLRPREDRPAEHSSRPEHGSRPEHSSRPSGSRRFPARDRGRDRPAPQEASVATLEHEVPSADPWRETLASPWDEEPAVAEPARTTLWDPALEEAFARTPSWADEDDERLLPKGANRIENGRRTIEIRGQVDRVHGFTAPADTTAATRSGRRRPVRRPSERLAGRPDRLALWAFLLGLLLIAIAAFTSPGDAGAAVHAAGF